MKLKALALMLMMSLSSICFAASEAAAANGEAAAQEGGSSWTSMVPMILIFVVMIFIFSRSNKKQQQKRQEMLDRIVKGTKVLLNSGVYGKVYEVREKEFVVEIADNVRVLVIKNGIASVEDEEEVKKAKDGDAK
jgi:preprotein translocase subunit YajC